MRIINDLATTTLLGSALTQPLALCCLRPGVTVADPWLSHALFTSDAAPDTSYQAPAEPSRIRYSLLSLRSAHSV